MNAETIKKIFQSPFNYPIYSREIVHSLFGCNDVLTQPELIDTSSLGDSSHYVGQMEDAEGRLLGFFYTRVAEGSDVRRKRVGLRKLIQPYLRYEVDAAIAVFDDGRHWRLSYICDHKEGTTSAKRFSYVLGDRQGQYKTPLERLDKVAAKAGHFNLEDLKEAFSVDALSKEFFDEYHRHYDRILRTTVELISKDPTLYSGLSKLFADYIKKMMGRIVILHFLQKKGWLNGDPDFLKNLFFMQSYDRREDFLEQVLEPLFFGIFNTEPQYREKLFRDEGWDVQLLEQWKGLPYLNGGLFERDSMDTAKLKLPASLFERLFEFMASYNFTVDENDPDDADIGVDPEMLGKIFESLLEDNKAKGAFYTPKEIVRYMCKESLIAYLGTQATGPSKEPGEQASSLSKESGIQATGLSKKPGEQASSLSKESEVKATALSKEPGVQSAGLSDYIRKFVEQHEFPEELEPYREVLDTALRNVKICDPAIGSGAFPMGLLNELWRCREALEERATNPSQMGTQANGLSQAGSLYSKEGQAGSLNLYSRAALKREIIENNIYGVDIEKGAIDIARLRFWLSIVVDAEKPEPLPNFDYKFMQGNSLIESFDGHDLSHILDKDRGGRSLPGKGSRKTGWAENQTGMEFGSDEVKQNLRNWLKMYFSLTDHKEKAYYRELINGSVKSYIVQQGIGPAAETRLNAIDPSANKHFFLWHTWFKDIFDKGGFDIVIANPPYISAIEAKKTIDDFVRQQYKKTYITASGTYDIYVIFIELGFILLGNDGILSYITPSKYLSAEYAKTLREVIIKYYSVEQISDFSSIRVFENAGVSTMISMFRKCKQRNTVRFESFKTTTEIESFHVYNKSVLSLLPNNLWGALLSNQIDLFLKIHSQSVTMEEFSEVNACSTAAEADEYENSLISEFNPDSFMYINNGTIDRYVHYWGKKKIRSKKILTPYLPFTALNSRRKNMFKKEKLLFVKLAKCPQVFLDERGEFASANTNMVYDVKQYNYKFLLGYFNSKLFDYVYKTMFGGNSMLGSIQVQAPQIRKSLIPKPSLLVKQQPIIDVVEEILQEKRINPNTDTTALEQQIDQLVYQLYNLTPEEIEIIEKTN